MPFVRVSHSVTPVVGVGVDDITGHVPPEVLHYASVAGSVAHVCGEEVSEVVGRDVLVAARPRAVPPRVLGV